MGMGGGRMKYDREVSQDSMSTKCEEDLGCVFLAVFPAVDLGKESEYEEGEVDWRAVLVVIKLGCLGTLTCLSRTSLVFSRSFLSCSLSNLHHPYNGIPPSFSHITLAQCASPSHNSSLRRSASQRLADN
jgi:hypothetical protein